MNNHWKQDYEQLKGLSYDAYRETILYAGALSAKLKLDGTQAAILEHSLVRRRINELEKSK